MNSKAKKYSVRTLSVALAGFLAAGVAVSLPKGDAGAYVAQSVNKSAAAADVTGLVSTDEIRRQYLNTDLVSENVLKPDAERWIVVDFGGKSVMDEYLARGAEGEFSAFAATAEAKNIASNLDAKHKRFLTELKNAGISFEYKYSYTTLNDGVAIKIKNRDFNTVYGMNNVATAYYSEAYAAPTAVDNNAHAYPSGIYDSSDVDQKGEGMVVAILDTGLDHTHRAFQHMPNVDGYEGYLNEDEVRAALPKTAAYTRTENLTVDQVYYNAKVPFAYDYADDDPIVFPSYSTHGTHVAGIIAGRDETQPVDKDTPIDTSNPRTFFTGVAPEAQLMICKVFTDDPDSRMLGGASEVDIIAALSDCATLGVDVINMSLGTSAGFTIPAEKDNVDNVYGKLEELGISLIVAASNDYSSGTGGGYGTNLASNPDSGTVGSPSTYTSALSVASIQGDASRYFLIGESSDESEAQSVIMTESSDANGNAYDFMQQLYDNPDLEDYKNNDGSMTLPYVVIGGVGNQSNYSSTSVRNQLRKGNTIALIRRGDITFAEKVEYAMANGAVACIIYNNVSGTIRMSLGDVENPVPTCSVNMEDGRSLVAAARSNVGHVTFSPSFRAGPFMSEFSSWGPTPDLKLKPEITAHGGEILSTIPGGYNTQSGTSMASPNMAGAIALLRQFIKENDPDATKTQIRDLSNQLVMSSATMALNEVGNPYSPRKQGAGLAGIKAAIDAESYITVKSIPDTVKIKHDKSAEDFDYKTYEKTGTTEAYETAGAVVSDKVKVEFGDDPSRTGIYDMTFEVHNQKNYAVKYTPKAYVMTETLASDLITVAERAYMLSPDVEYWVNGEPLEDGAQIVVGAKGTATGTVKVQVVISLSAKDRDYLESSFKNGMYVEGFIRLEAEGGKFGNVSTVELGIPFLAFYGDWTKAPMFDYDVFEIAENEKDTSVDPEDKIKAQAAATQPLGLYWDDQYVIPLGTYLYDMSPFDNEIYPEAKKASISAFDNASQRTIYQLYNVSAGLLRNARRLRVAITDTATGERVYDNIRSNIGKAYASAAGGNGAMVLMELNPKEWNLPSNSTYRYDLVGELDYALRDGQRSPIDMAIEDVPEDYKFTFEFTVDTERPTLAEYRVRYEPYTQNNVTKYNVFLDIDVNDNNYLMDGMPCYLRDVEGEKEYDANTGEYVQAQQLALFTDYPIPAYSGKGETATLSFEITDYYEDIVNGRGIFEPDEAEKAAGKKSSLYFAVEDYAMNQSVYSLDITQAKGFTESPVTLGEDARLKLSGTKEGTHLDELGETLRYTFNTYTLSLQQYDNYNVVVNTQPDTSLAGAVTIVAKANSTLLRAKDREIFALGTGGSETVDVVLEDPSTGTNKVVAQITVTVAGTGVKPVAESISLEPVFDHNFALNTLTGTSPSLELNPGQEVTFKPTLQPWYCNALYDYDYVLTSSNETSLAVVKDSVDEKTGGKLLTVRAETRGEATARIQVPGMTRLSRSVQVTVNNEYDVRSYNLTHFYGDGDNGVVVVPEHYNIMTMSEGAFQFNTKIKSVKLSSELTQIPEEAFRGCVNLEYVYIPSKVIFIGEAAFAGCTKLKTVEFAKTDDYVTKEENVGIGAVALGRNCFRNCTALDTIINEQRITTAYDYAFSGCTALTKIDISGLRVAGESVFGTAPATRSGEYGWGMLKPSAASGLTTVITGPDTVFGPYMFRGCPALASVGENKGSDSAPDYVLGIPRLSDGAFMGCGNLTSIKFDPNVNVYYFGNEAFRETKIGTITLPAGSYSIGAGAFAGCGELTTVNIGADTEILSFGGAITRNELAPFGIRVTELLHPFQGCKKFNAFAVSGNSRYTVEGGILYNSGKTTVLAVPNGKGGSVSLNGVTAIGPGAFAGTNIATLSAGSVTDIGAYAFENCTDLTTVTLSASLTEIKDGTFAGCTALNNINLGNVVKIGNQAFAGTALSGTLTLAAAEKVGDFAFNGVEGITKLTANALKKIGDNAFVGTSLAGELALPAAEEIGNQAFHKVTGITAVKLGPVTYMGGYAFAEITGLRTEFRDSEEELLPNVSIAEGGTTVGAYAFYGSYPVYVKLPSTMEIIGAGAFMEETYEREVDNRRTYGLKKLTIARNTDTQLIGNDLIIGDMAFFNCYFLQFDSAEPDILSNTSYIGVQAFMRDGDVRTEDGGNSPLGMVTNPENVQEKIPVTLNISADVIGGGAFINAGLTGINLTSKANEKGGTLILGAEAFRDNDFTSITIPASLCSYLFEDQWEYYSLSGDWLIRKDKFSEAFGGGAFGGNSRLTAINVEGTDGPFFSENGVLYARVEEGYVLVQYPANKRGPDRVGTDSEGNALYSYTVKEGTVRIAYGAFYGVSRLNEVHIPYSVRSIGAYAFFQATSLLDYYFEGVEAPVLEAPYVEDSFFDADESLHNLWISGLYYSNFYNYLVGALGMDYDLTLHRPENGKGYEDLSAVWELYFWSNPVELTAYAADNNTHRAMELIDALLSAQEIHDAVYGKGTDAEKQAEIKRISKDIVQAARKAFNLVTEARQLAFVGEERVAALLAAEKTVREIKADLGIPALVAEIVITSRPDKTAYYLGESFDRTGLVVTAVYDDLSREEVTNYTLNVSGVFEELGRFEVVVTYEGKTASFYINVAEKEEGEGDEDGALVGIIVGSVVGGVAVVAAAVVTVLLLKKRKGAKEGASEGPQDSDNVEDENGGDEEKE